MKQHHNQSGALLIEVLAVLGLIGMMAPFLYKQALERNREVSNIAIAGEMRTVAEALRTAIEVDFMNDLNTNCTANFNQQNTTTNVLCNDANLTTRFYLPDGAALDSYSTQVWCRNTLEICTCDLDHNACGAGNDCTDRGNVVLTYDEPVCFGVVMSVANNLPQNLTLRRARRIASLIGSSGGVCTAATHIDGTMGGWSLDTANRQDNNGDTIPGATGLNCPLDPNSNYGLAATTGVITEAIGTGEIVGQAATENITAIPPNVGFRDLHAWNYFSVGNGTKENCFAPNRTGNSNAFANADGDTIYRVGGGNNPACDPLFWVGTPGPDSAGGANNSDHSDAGNVYVRNSLIVGRDNTNQTQAVELGMNATNDAGVITVYNTNGTEVITLEGGRPNSATVLTLRDDVDAGDNQNRIIMTTSTGQDSLPQIDLIEQTNAGNTNVGMRLTSQGLEGLGADSAFKVDPRFTSRMTDIEIGARGNARLSQILPNYILKNVVNITGNTGNDGIPVPASTNTPSNDGLTCPTGYARVLVVIPTGGTKVELATDNEQNLLPITEQENVPVSVNTGTGRGTLTIPELTPKANALVNGYPAVSIANNDSPHKKVDDSDANAGQWNVTLGRCTQQNCAGNSFVADNTMTAIAHVYCVYTGNGDIDAPTDTTATNAQLNRAAGNNNNNNNGN